MESFVALLCQRNKSNAALMLNETSVRNQNAGPLASLSLHDDSICQLWSVTPPQHLPVTFSCDIATPVASVQLLGNHGNQPVPSPSLSPE